MRDQHLEIADRFERLRASRSNPIYFVEHGLTSLEVESLKDLVREHLAVHPLDDPWWNARSLPLVVVATEVGYRYRGSGTDFWPVLEGELEHPVPAGWRSRVRDMFASAASEFGGARPPATAWAKAFHLIAWPITHALLPRELHRPLALTLGNIRDFAGTLKRDDLLRAIRFGAVETTSRFSSLIEDEDLMGPLAQALLEGDSGHFSEEIVQRITADLDRDFVARRSVRDARSRKRQARERERCESDPVDTLPKRVGDLRLQFVQTGLVLEATLPAFEGDLASKTRRALRRRRFAPRLFGVSQPVPSEQLLSGLPFPIRLQAVPAEGSPFIPGLDELGIVESAQAFLRSLSLPISAEMLFAKSSSEGPAWFIRGPEVSAYREYVLLSTTKPLADRGVHRIGELGPYGCYAIDPQEEPHRKLLEALGYSVRFKLRAVQVGVPNDPNGSTFWIHDPLIFFPERLDGSQFQASFKNERVTGSSGDCIVLSAEHGANQLVIDSGSLETAIEFEGEERALAFPIAPVCYIESHSTDTSIGALVRGDLEFEISSFAPLEGMPCRVELDGPGVLEAASTVVERLPASVRSDAPAFETLISRVGSDRLFGMPYLDVRLSVGGITTRSWRLERRLRPCWWEETEPGQYRLMSDLGVLRHRAVHAEAPCSEEEYQPTDPDSDVVLLTPLDLDIGEFGSAARFAGLCLATRAGKLAPKPFRLPAVHRGATRRDEALGLHELIEYYLRWSLAESRNGLAEIRRRQVAQAIDLLIGRVACGDKWASAEEQISWVEPWRHLSRVASDSGLGRDSYLTGISDDTWGSVLGTAIDTLRASFPSLWTRFRTENTLSSSEWEAFEAALLNGYEEQAMHLDQQGKTREAATLREGDPSADFDPEAWTRAVRIVITRLDLHPLASRLTPTDSLRHLASIDPMELGAGDIAEELSSWCRSNSKALQGSAPDDMVLLQLAQLWLAPDSIAGDDLSEVVQVLVAERSLSRTARYLALRSRQARIWTGS